MSSIGRVATPELDLTESGDTFRTNLGVDTVLTGSLMPANQLYANGHDLAHPYVSPLFGDFTKGYPPTCLYAGTRDLFLSNAAGGLDPAFGAGTLMVIRDHINLTGRSPLVGGTFVDLTDLYSSRLRAMCREVDPSLDEGVYVQFPGPHYETPAEIHFIRTIGATLAGMSTVLETIAAREADMEVLGVSLVTNLAAGMTGEPLSHDEVLAAGRAAAERMGGLLAAVLKAM